MIDWTAIVGQAPAITVALLFAWFTLRITKAQQEYLEKRDKLFTDELTRLSNQIGAMNDALILHDERTKVTHGRKN